jgi:mannosyl-glycoprotein endo-beta-N-acetylglucosaminidase
MLHTTRRLLTGPLLVAAIGAGLIIAPGAANAAVAATVQVGSTLKVRSAPSLSARIVGSVRNKQRVTVQCVVPGTNVRGSVRTTTLWDRLSTGHYISHAYVRAAGTIARCANPSPQAVPVRAKPAPAAVTYKVGTIRSSDGNVNLRFAPSTTAAVRTSYANGATVKLLCGVVGTMVSGTVRTTTQWDRTTTGYYLSHAYVDSPTLTLCKGVTTPPTSSVSLTPAQFIAAAVPGAQFGWRQYGVPPSVTIAQAILESGWGKSGLASVDKNYFGIKCFNGSYGTLANGCHVYQTNECTKAGSCFATTASFRTYASMANSFRDHGNFLRVNSRYRPAFAYTKNANKFIWTVWKAGYATDPNYYTKITGIMTANKLYQYDTWK